MDVQKTDRLIRRFYSSFLIDEKSGCWMWTKTKSGHPEQFRYGRVRQRHDKSYAAHRLSYMIHVGKIPDGILVCHKCDTPLCVNPEHLFLATHLGNMIDAYIKGRKRRKHEGVGRGSQHPNAKLTEESVIEIRRLNGVKTHKEMAKKFGVSRSAISGIVNRRGWAWLEE